LEHARSTVQRCAIYSRKSSEEGLEQSFNSLQAQREACEAFIRSQTGEGWRLLETPYDDGGISGATMERPALQRLLSDIDQGLIDVVVVYKIDRLTRSLTDFSKIIEIFDAHHVSFISTTQQFNTTSSMGRLTLNILLSFAQYERELTGERIRDKISASKKKGLWLGGYCPLGYDVRDRQLVINPKEAKLVRHIYKLYLELNSVRLLKQDLDRRGIVSKVRISKTGTPAGGKSFSRGALYQLLANPLYLGEVRHNKLRYPGQHQAIVDRRTWEEVQRRLRVQTARNRFPRTHADASFLAGKLFDENGEPLRAVGAKGRHGAPYRYYASRELITAGCSPKDADKGWRLAAKELERSIIVSARAILKDQAAIATAAQEAGASTAEIGSVLRAAEAKIGLLESDSQAPLAVAELVKRVDLRNDGIDMMMNLEALLPLDAAMRSAPWTRFTRYIPLQMKRRGVAMRLVIGAEVSTRKTDLTLLRAVARGHKWFDALLSGRASFARDIAAREGVNERFVRRLIPLAFLSPSIVEMIAEGRQPMSLTAEALSRGIDISPDWDKQNAALGFDRGS